MSQSLASAPSVAPERPAGRRALDMVGRAILGSDRPWDPANRAGLIALCVILIIGLGIAYPHFLTVDNAFTIALNITAYGIATLGSGLLIISGNVDLSIGGMYALVAVVTATVARDTLNPVLAFLTAPLLGALLGYINGRLVRTLKINPLIVTLGMAAILRGLAFVVTDARSVFGFPAGFVALGRAYIGPVPLPVLIGAIVFVVGGFCLLKTVVGLHIYATGGNMASTTLAGIRAQQLVTSLYTVNGALIGLVAVLTTARLGSASPLIGTQFELDVLTAAILGGAAFTGGGGHPLGLIFGVITIGVINAGIIFAGVADFWQQIVKGSILILALAADQYTERRRARSRSSETLRETAADAAKTAGVERPPAPAGELAEVKREQAKIGDVVLSCKDISKSYGAVAAVRDVSFAVRSGEVVCLVGDNGAGKSTLIKMLSGAVEPDGGIIEVRGKPVQMTDPHVARSFGIETAYQDLALCPNLGAAYNLVLGAEPVRFKLGPFSIRDDKRAMEMARARLEELGITLGDAERPVRLLSGGQRQSVAIARIAGHGVETAILDEPTAALGVRQTRNVLNLILELAKRGTGVIMITHDIEDVFQVADRVVVLRLGQVVYDGPRADLTPMSLVHLMAGLTTIAPAASAGAAAT